MPRFKPPTRPADMLARLFTVFALLLASLGANADDVCNRLYPKSGAVPGDPQCVAKAAANTPIGMGTYYCTAQLDLVREWCGSVPQPEDSCPVADPVHPASGAVTLSAVDFISGDDIALIFKRTYRSKPLAQNVNAMGPAWFHNWQRQLGLANANSGGSSTVTAYRENGDSVVFNWSGGTWRTVDFTGLALAQTQSGWRLTNLTNDAVESYSAQGILLSETTKTGFIRTLSYDSAGLLTAITQHGAGTSANNDLTLRFDYDDKRRISRLNDPIGGITQYEYDTNSNLLSVTWPDGYARRYVYEDARFKNAITGEIDEAGARIATWTYDAQGRATLVSHPDTARNVQFGYSNGSTTVTDSHRTTTLNFSSIGGKLRATGSNSSAGNSTSTWDASGRLLKNSFVSGNAAEYSYDDVGRPVRLVARNASGVVVTSIRYADATTLHPWMIASPRKMQTLVYDSRGNVTGVSETPTTDTTGESGFDALKADGVTRAYGRVYDEWDRLSSVRIYYDGVQSAAFRLSRDDTGNVKSVVHVGGAPDGFDEASQASARDAAHRIVTGYRPNGGYNTRYDKRGRPDLIWFNDYPAPLNGGVHRLLKVWYRYSPDSQIVSRTGTVSTNDGPDVAINSDEIDQWVANMEDGRVPVGPAPNLAGLVRSLLGAAPDAIQPICIECILNPALSWGWAMSSNHDDPFGIVGLAGAIRGAVGGMASQCKPTQLTTDQLIAEATTAQNSTGLSKLARAWDKHSGREPDFYPALSGNVDAKNATTEAWLRNLMENPTTVRSDLGRGGIEYRAPDGTGARWNSGGGFSGVLNPPQN
ncbi:DUF6531 domain-containing protein [Paraburkholderia sediminicola]|uniref:DUF6531 domain-containing protein n=1 Tax=Paraburkholderia sediminicola TaxID=458836 RepID=UPI0038BAE2E8